MAHGAAHDAAEHIAAAFVRRQHAVGDQERRRAQMVGDDAGRRLLRPVGVDAGEVGDLADDRREQVDLVVVVRPLQHRGDALEPHAGVDRGLRQVDALAARQLLVLHEDEIPDLDEAVAVGVRRARRPARDVRAVVVEDFRARAAGADVAHLPEIVGAGDADDLLVRQSRDLLPELERLIVVDIDGDGQAILGQPEILGDQIPGELDGAVLEVIAEREVAEHLEERVVARGVADIVEVVVLAAGAHAFLRGRGLRIGALFEAGEDVLELHHPGIGEHQGRVVARHQRRRRHHGVAVGREVIEELPPDLVDAAHIRSGIPPLNAGLLQRICSGGVPVCPERRFRGVYFLLPTCGRHEDGRAALPGHHDDRGMEGDRGAIPPRPRRRHLPCQCLPRRPGSSRRSGPSSGGSQLRSGRPYRGSA